MSLLFDEKPVFEQLFHCSCYVPLTICAFCQQLKLVMDSIIWAFRHTERNVAETGLNLLLEMLTNFQVMCRYAVGSGATSLSLVSFFNIDANESGIMNHFVLSFIFCYRILPLSFCVSDPSNSRWSCYGTGVRILQPIPSDIFSHHWTRNIRSSDRHFPQAWIQATRAYPSTPILPGTNLSSLYTMSCSDPVMHL